MNHTITLHNVDTEAAAEPADDIGSHDWLAQSVSWIPCRSWVDCTCTVFLPSLLEKRNYLKRFERKLVQLTWPQMCRRRSVWWMNVCGQMWHACGRSPKERSFLINFLAPQSLSILPVWILVWICSFCLSMKPFPHLWIIAIKSQKSFRIFWIFFLTSRICNHECSCACFLCDTSAPICRDRQRRGRVCMGICGRNKLFFVRIFQLILTSLSVHDVAVCAKCSRLSSWTSLDRDRSTNNRRPSSLCEISCEASAVPGSSESFRKPHTVLADRGCGGENFIRILGGMNTERWRSGSFVTVHSNSFDPTLRTL